MDQFRWHLPTYRCGTAERKKQTEGGCGTGHGAGGRGTAGRAGLAAGRADPAARDSSLQPPPEDVTGAATPDVPPLPSSLRPAPLPAYIPG